MESGYLVKKKKKKKEDKTEIKIKTIDQPPLVWNPSSPLVTDDESSRIRLVSQSLFYFKN